MPVYQIRSSSSGLPQDVAMLSKQHTEEATPTTQQTEEADHKKKIRLMRNRLAARECRRKKKEFVKCLENHIAVLENQNKTLLEELKSLQDMCHKSE